MYDISSLRVNREEEMSEAKTHPAVIFFFCLHLRPLKNFH